MGPVLEPELPQGHACLLQHPSPCFSFLRPPPSPSAPSSLSLFPEVLPRRRGELLAKGRWSPRMPCAQEPRAPGHRPRPGLSRESLLLETAGNLPAGTGSPREFTRGLGAAVALEQQRPGKFSVDGSCSPGLSYWFLRPAIGPEQASCERLTGKPFYA